MASTASAPQTAGQPAEQVALQLEVLGRGLDHEVAVRRGPRRSGRCGAAPAPPRPPPRSSGRARRRGAGRCGDLDPALERLAVEVVEDGLVAAERGDLGDPGAHRPGADDPDPAALGTLTQRPRSRAFASRGRPASPRPGPRSPSRPRTGGARPRRPAVSPVSSAVRTASFARRAASGGRRAITCGELHRLRRASSLLAGHLVDEAHLVRLLGAEAAAGQDQLHRPLPCRRSGPAAGCRRRRG